MTRHTLTETATLTQPTGRRIDVQLITPGWGSSGYYSEACLADAATRQVFPAGTHMYLDHPTAQEDADRPERSVKDLVAVLEADATVDPATGGLRAPARVFGPWKDVLSEMADAIGVSIRATGTAGMGVAEGRKGLIIERLDEGLSVDFVTAAGRGGRVLSLLESARTKFHEVGTVGQWLESRLHLTLTQIADDLYGDGCLTRDERITLSSAIGDGLQAWTARVQADAPQLFQRSMWEPIEEPAEQPEEPMQTTADEAARPGSDTQPVNQLESKEPTVAELNEAEERELREAAHRATVVEAENAELRRQLAEANARAAANPVLDRLIAEAELPAASVTAVREAALRDLPIGDDGLDEAAFTEAATAVIDAKRAEIAAIAESLGAGTVRGFGGTPTNDDGGSDPTARLAEAFTDLGLSESTAKTAARGRA